MKLNPSAAAAAAALLLAACLDPVYDPTEVYDVEPLVKNEPMDGYDTVRITLLPMNSAADAEVLWKGSPFHRPRLPLYQGPKDLQYELRMEAWKDPAGLCFIARFSGEYRKVDLNSCQAPGVFEVDPPAMTLYLGGPSDTVYMRLDRVWPDPANVWQTSDDGVAKVDAKGVVTAVGAGNAWVFAGRDPLRDSCFVHVVWDAPELNISADTTVNRHSEISHAVEVKQLYGGVAAFGWEWESDQNDQTWDDSIKNFPREQTLFATPKRLYDAEGTHIIAFYIRDGEGNTVYGNRSVYVAGFRFPFVTVESPSATAYPTFHWSGQEDAPNLYRWSLDNSKVDFVGTPINDTSYTPTTPIPDGSHTFYVQQFDGKGKWSVAGSCPFLVSVGPLTRYPMDSVEFFGTLANVGINTPGAAPTAVVSDSDRNGNPVGAARFNGQTSVAVVGASEHKAGTRITFTAWLKPDSLGPERRYFLYGEEGFRAFVDEKGAGIDIMSEEDTATGRIPLEKGKWTFFAATFDRKEIRTYKDGVFVKAVSHAGTVTGSLTGLLLGNSPDRDAGFAGVLDDIRVYNRVLTPENIEDIRQGRL